MNAYAECYIYDAMRNMGNMMDYAVNDCKLDPDIFFLLFAQSQIGRSFSIGCPRYVVGQSGTETAMDVIYLGYNYYPDAIPNDSCDRSAEYWAGWAYAYYQWKRAIGFDTLIRRGLTMKRVIDAYILHEADISQFVEWADNVIQYEKTDTGAMLKRLRKYWGYTQKEVSEQSGVSLRMIQLYEQGHNDITKAQAQVVNDLARALKCEAKDLVE